MGPVERLKKTWQALTEKHPKSIESSLFNLVYKELLPLVSSRAQYAQYRKFVKDMAPPAIPFLGINLTDLTFIEDGNSDFLPDSHLINFDKRLKVYSLIRDQVIRFQKTRYNFQYVPVIQDFLRFLSDNMGSSVGWNENEPVLSYDELEQTSFAIEPQEIIDD